MIEWNKKGLERVQKKLVFALNKTGTDTLTNINSANVVPFNVGELEKSGTVEDVANINKTVKISWNMPYAHRLYVHPEYNFQNGRKGRWADAWIRGGKQKWVLDTFQTNASKELK